MKSLEEVKDILARNKGALRERFKVKELGIFGSFVKGRQRKRSDIDVLVVFEEGYKTFDNYMDLKFFLEGILDAKVDLVLKNTLREEIKEHILSEAIYV
ncbi:MAG TPA: nucleotidyltransferase family protein [Candidatus Tripitaka californicus]|uniref:nucleotidyltransferase family protein n=1 Tax=Candidatus Tripitaka californicus TaxID=3367616 RepID=UPI0040291E92|nr:nucleotidyltransferase family protein [Planctomycetota bacterium]